MPGPVPKRESERRRRNKPDVPVQTAPGAAVVKIPPANHRWHPIARRLWTALRESGQSAFYEPSDWAFAYSLMDDLTYVKTATDRGEKRPAVMLATVYSSLERLLVAEGDRRRLRMELMRPGNGDGHEDPAKVAILDEYRRHAQ